MIETSQNLKFADSQIENFKRTILHKQLTDSELNVSFIVFFFKGSKLLIDSKFTLQKLKPDNPVYQGVGRCFFRSTVPEVRGSLAKDVSGLQDKIKHLE